MKELRIPFKGWDLVAFLNEKDGEEMVAVKPIAEAIGVEPRRQLKKIQANPDLSWVLMYTTGSDGKQYEMLCLPVKQLNGWLYSINSNKVREDVRPKLKQFKEECHIAIYNHMNGSNNPQVLEILYKIISRLEEVEKENKELKEQIRIHNQMLGLEASMAGKRLVAARHLKLVGE